MTITDRRCTLCSLGVHEFSSSRTQFDLARRNSSLKFVVAPFAKFPKFLVRKPSRGARNDRERGGSRNFSFFSQTTFPDSVGLRLWLLHTLVGRSVTRSNGVGGLNIFLVI